VFSDSSAAVLEPEEDLYLYVSGAVDNYVASLRLDGSGREQHWPSWGEPFSSLRRRRGLQRLARAFGVRRRAAGGRLNVGAGHQRAPVPQRGLDPQTRCRTTAARHGGDAACCRRAPR